MYVFYMHIIYALYIYIMVLIMHLYVCLYVTYVLYVFGVFACIIPLTRTVFSKYKASGSLA